MSKRETLCDYFDEDVVIRHSKSGRLIFGLVIESSENASDFEDDEEDSDSQSSHSNHKLRPGFAKIACYPSGNTVVVKESKVKLYDRSLLSGDVVQRIDRTNNKLDQNSEHGFCKSIKIFATLKLLGTDRVVDSIECSQLEMISNISVDTVCLFDSWIGYIKEVNHRITLKTTDGSTLIVNDIDLDDFSDLLTQRDNNESEFSQDNYYIGQQLYGPKKHLKNAVWVTKTKRMKNLIDSNSSRDSKIHVVVEDVVVESVSVNWLYCLSKDNHCKSESQACEPLIGSIVKNLMKNIAIKSRDNSYDTSQPNDSIIGESIKRIKCLNYFGKCSLQMGHQCYYTITNNDNVMKFSDWEKTEAKKLTIDSEIDLSQKSKAIENIGTDHSYALSHSVTLKNGSISGSLSSISSFGSINSKNKKRRKKCKNHIWLPLSKVKKKKLQASHRTTSYLLPINTSVGSRLPVEIVSTRTRVTVMWQNGTLEEDIPSIFLYPVHHIDDHDFYPSDFVVQNKDCSELFDYGVVQKCDFHSRIATVKWFTVPFNSDTAQFVAQEDVSVYDIKDHPDFNYRSGCCVVRISKDDSIINDVSSRAGQVIEINLEGKLKCVWADGNISYVYPQELFVIGDYDSDDLWDDSDSEYDDYSDLSYSDRDEESWETDSEQTDVDKNATNKSAKKSKPNAKLSISQVLIMKFVNIATQLEECLKNGTLNHIKIIQKAIKYLEHSHVILDKLKSRSDFSHNMRTLNEVNQFSKRLMSLTETFRQCLPEEKQLIESETSEASDLKSSQKSQNNGKDLNAFQSTNLTDYEEIAKHTKKDKYRDCTKESLLKAFQSANLPDYEEIAKHELKVTNLYANETLSSDPVIPPLYDVLKPFEDLIDWSKVDMKTDVSRTSVSDWETMQENNNCNEDNDSFEAKLIESEICEASDLKRSQKSQTNSVDCLSASQTNVLKFLEIVNNLKSDLLKIGNLSTNGQTFDENLGECSQTPILLDNLENESNIELNENCSLEVSRNDCSEEIKVNTALNESKGKVIYLESVPDCHKYSATVIQPKNMKEFIKRVKQEISLLQTALPDGIDVALFEDRMDLLSVVVFGPKGTPYEDGLFLFDIQLPANYPNVPPLVHYISYCSDRLNPNLYENGKVCISLLGTWSGKGTEVWSASTSNLLQLIISIQGLILVAEPYYNEAGYTRQRGTTIACDNSRLYNEMVVIKLIQSMTKLLLTPPKTFETSIKEHFIKIGEQFIERHKHWASISEECISKSITTVEGLNEYKQLRKDVFWPQFPLLPASYGFCLSLNKAIDIFKEIFLSIN